MNTLPHTHTHIHTHTHTQRHRHLPSQGQMKSPGHQIPVRNLLTRSFSLQMQSYFPGRGRRWKRLSRHSSSQPYSSCAKPTVGSFHTWLSFILFGRKAQVAAQELPTPTLAEFHLLVLKTPTLGDTVPLPVQTHSGSAGTMDAFQAWEVWWPLGSAMDRHSSPALLHTGWTACVPGQVL